MLKGAFQEHMDLMERSREGLLPELERAARLAENCLRSGGKVLVFGNGGSAAQAQHFAAELVGRFERDRRGFPAISLTTDTSALTAIGNDNGFRRVFQRQVEALAREGDVVLAISTSGNSENVLEAVKAARGLNCPIVGLTGEGGGRLAELCDVLLAVPSRKVSRIQELHILCLHCLAQWVEDRLLDPGWEELA
jgi:D-sedoheptulose 7-phosphate isomerase